MWAATWRERCAPVASPSAHLVRGQDLEGGHDLLRRVGLGGLAGHEVDEGLEGHHARVVGVHQGHDARKLHLALSGGRRRRSAQFKRCGERTRSFLTVACARCTHQVVAHGDEAGAEVVRIHHAVSLLRAKGERDSLATVKEIKRKRRLGGVGEGLTLSKWLKEALNSLSCSWLMPLASRVRIWFSTSLMVLAMVVSSCSQPTRTCCKEGGGEEMLTD